MLNGLNIRNFTLIDSLDITLHPGLNIITGETGAGKSIIVDALLLLFGERGSTEYVRKGAPKAVIEGTFSIAGNTFVRRFIQDHEFDSHSDELLLRREISDKGVSRSFINDTPATLNLTKELGNFLVDFHGQHEHQSLLKSEFHVHFLDTFDEIPRLLAEYQTAWTTLKKQLQELAELSAKELSLREQAELRAFQLQELEQVNPERGEEQDLEEELSRREHAEQLFDLTHQLSAVLYESEQSVRDGLSIARKILDDLSNIDKVYAEFRSECQSAIVLVEEIVKFTQRYHNEIAFEPERLEEIRHRLLQLSRLRKKYGTMDDLFEKWDALKAEQQLTENFEEEIQKRQKEIVEQRIIVGKTGERLSKARQKAASRLEGIIIASLQNLGMPHIRFSIKFDRYRLPQPGQGNELYGTIEKDTITEHFVAFAHGLDDVEFLIAANPGEELKPLARIASGGEISRVMLALKQGLAESNRLPLMVFDEIDTGISGRIAQKVGKVMRELSKVPQIIAITHQPQIAAFANAHILVEKIQTATATQITARVLSNEEHIREVARLLSGEEITGAALQSAEELIAASNA